MARAIRAYLTDHAEWLDNLPAGQLRLLYAATIPAQELRPALVHGQFIQQYQGMDVEGSYVHFTVKLFPGRSVLMSVSANVYPRLRLPHAIPQGRSRLLEAAVTRLKISSKDVRPKREHRKVRFIGNRWRRVTELRFADSHLKAVVDEDTVESWDEEERLYGTVQGTVRGRGVRFDPTATGTNLDTLDLTDLDVNAASGSVSYTDTTGQFNFATETGTTTVTADLQGRWALTTSAGDEPALALSRTATAGVPVTLFFNETGASEIPTAQVNGYYHTTWIHNWIRSRLPSPGLVDLALWVNVNLFDVCNAYYDLSGFMGFFQSGGGCINSAYDTVIYHEYGHYVDDLAGSDYAAGIDGITDGGLSEGWGDIVATYATSQPLIGEGFRGAGTVIRTADNTYQYPATGSDEVHQLGQAWAGFAWHLRQNLSVRYGNTLGVEKAESLILPTLLANSADIPQAVEDVMILDDDDGNLSNGTPHFQEIIEAAMRHGIPLSMFVEIAEPVHDASLAPEGDVMIRGTANAGPEFQQYALAYGRGANPTVWNAIGGPITSPVVQGTLGTWTVDGLDADLYTIRLTVTTRSGTQLHDLVRVELTWNPVQQITTDPGRDEDVDISGPLIVWMRDSYDLFVHDLRTGQEYPINAGAANFTPPAIDGARIVWSSWDNGRNLAICEYDAEQHTCPARTLITAPGQQWAPKVSGTRIVWNDDRNGSDNVDIYLCDLDTSSGACPEQPIVTKPGNQYVAAIDDSRILWTDFSSGSGDVVLCDYDSATRTCEEVPIITHPAHQSAGDVQGNRIVWTDRRNDQPQQPIVNTDVYFCEYQPLTHLCPEQPLTTDPRGAGYPQLSGDHVVWQDNRNGSTDIYVYDQATHEETAVTLNSANQLYPTIDGSRIVWTDLRNNHAPTQFNYDIYLHEVGPHEVSGRVLASDTQQPLVGATVTVQPRGSSVIVAQAASDANGAYRVSLPAGSYSFSGTLIDYAGVTNAVIRTALTLDLVLTRGLPLDRPPVLEPIPDATIDESIPFMFTVSATDPDPGSVLTFHASRLPPGASFDPATRRFTWTPSAIQAGNYPNVRFEVSDGQLSHRQEIAITVREANLAIAGRIVNTTKQPVIGVLVKGSGTYPDRRRVEATTGADGIYLLSNLHTVRTIERKRTLCQNLGICRPFTVTVTPKKLGIRFIDPVTGKSIRSRKVTFDPTNLRDAIEIDFTGQP